MNIFNRLFGRKDSQARIALSFRQVGNPISTPRNYEGFAKEGYQKNVIVYRCISMIAQACGGIDWELYNKSRKGGKQTEISEHALLTLIERPNPMMGRSSFFESFVSYYKLTGNSFIESVRPRPTLPPMELWPTRPDKMQIVPGARGYPDKYIFKAGEVSKTFPVDPVKLKSDMFHMKSFHPLNDWWGMSPLEAALYALDQSNSGQKWNLALLQNSATPSGVLQMKVSDSNPNGSMTEEQFGRLKTEIESEYAGAKNAGRPMLLEGGLEWKQISMSPKDMEFLQNKQVTSTDIAEVYGVPPEMLGLGQKTFNNYKEARMSFFEDTILPLMDQIATELNAWLVPMFGENLVLKYDKDDIEALAPKREAKFISVQNASWLTVNEKREATGYEPKEGWDVFVIGSDLIADPSDYMTEPEEPLPNEDLPEKESEQIQEPEEDDGEKGFKSFNLLNRNEKKTSWRKQNWKRKRLESSFSRDLSSDLKELYTEMVKAIGDKTDARLLEYALTKGNG
jgi:HK97 family phage portal protein